MKMNWLEATGYAKDALKEVLGNRQLDSQSFVDYFLIKLLFFEYTSEDLDLNLYFERFNSRGEQLEAHEILKAQMMAKFPVQIKKWLKSLQEFGMPAEFDKPVLKAFQIRSRPNNTDEEGERKFLEKNLIPFKLESVFEK